MQVVKMHHMVMHVLCAKHDVSHHLGVRRHDNIEASSTARTELTNAQMRARKPCQQAHSSIPSFKISSSRRTMVPLLKASFIFPFSISASIRDDLQSV
jgi:hypothetical protein